MTKRLIYLEDAIDALAKWFHDDVFGITESDGTATIFKRLRELPSAQPERKMGKWIEKEYSPFYCSVCGTYQYSASWEIKNKEYNFCPRCGADMRGDEE